MSDAEVSTMNSFGRLAKSELLLKLTIDRKLDWTSDQYRAWIAHERHILDPSIDEGCLHSEDAQVIRNSLICPSCGLELENGNANSQWAVECQL